MNATPEVLRFDDLTPYLLLKNGNFLYKVPFRGGWAVLKVYYGSRGFFSNVVKSLENVVLAGQTSYMPRTRRRVEQECMAVWREHGVRVFNTYPDVVVEAPNCPPGGYMLFEYVSAPKLDGVLRDSARPVEERLALFRRFLQDWCRRHELAVAEGDPRLVHENGDSNHVMILPDALLWFDFEMIYRSRRGVRMHVGHEIIQYLWFLTKRCPPEIRDRLMEETVRHYPSRARLQDACDHFLHHPNILGRWARALDRIRKDRQTRDKSPSKYAVAAALQAQLGPRMTFRGLRLPPGAEILCADGKGGTGNVTLVFRGEQPPRVLKIYRTRRSRLREALGGFSHRFIEGKRGASAAARCETERLAIALWAREGFDVVRRLERPPPEEIREPCNWLAFMDAPTLQAVLADPTVTADRKSDTIRRLAADCARRHRRALESNEPLLIHERGHVGHVFVTSEALVWFDLENGFRPGFPLLRAIARELAGVARSLLPADPAPGEPLLAAFAAGYADRDLLVRAVREGQRGLPLPRQQARAALLRRLLT